jgi:ABC-2 type transport system ATP-binding protein
VNVIEAEGLRKSYRRLRGGSTTALSGLDLTVSPGGVFGFLGPNGAGKTTTIRCLLGLIRPSGGHCRLLGAETESEIASVIGRVGSIVETPTFFPGMSGRKNLRLLAGLRGVGSRAVDATLERVGLADRARDRVKTYSLGMKQRLGIAAALLKDPEVLILDEPANGLDPAGIKEVRELLRSLGAEGRTVFVSSHILSEVRQTCDRVAILARGACVAAGPVDEVLSGAGRLLVNLDDLEAGRRALTGAGIHAEISGERLVVNLAGSEAARVTQALADRGLYLTELRRDEADLETVFLELTADPESSP